MSSAHLDSFVAYLFPKRAPVGCPKLSKIDYKVNQKMTPKMSESRVPKRVPKLLKNEIAGLRHFLPRVQLCFSFVDCFFSFFC